MNSSQLFQQIRGKRSYLCVGLDTDLKRIPKHLLSEKDPVFEFNRQLIDSTHAFCVAYKPNIAFYEAMGPQGWESLQKTLEYIPSEIFTIADAKRGDIGSTSALYAKAFFENLDFDAVTVAPYMGRDSVIPFLEYPGRWVIMLAHTSNPGSSDFQLMESMATGRKLYEEVIVKGCAWATSEQLMFVAGGTHPEKISDMRRLAPEYFFLVPGIGSQGGDLGMVSKLGMTSRCGLLVNSSRDVIYASNAKDFAEAAARKAHDVQQEMNRYLDAYL